MAKKKYSVQAKVRRITDLYITYRKQFITQKDDGTYSRRKYTLKDSEIREHLNMKKTVGIFCGEDLTKCLIFDVDFEDDLPKAKEVTRNLVFTLEQEFFINKEQMLVSFSGNKGYHVAIFFDSVTGLKKIEQFYEIVLENIGCTTKEVERRPLPGIGVKLPLSINKKTGKRCHLVNPNTLYEIHDDALFEVKQINTLEFVKNFDRFVENKEHIPTVVLPKKKGEEFQTVLDITNFDIPIDYEERCERMLEENSLIYKDSRNNSTLLLLIFLKELDYEKEQAIKHVEGLISNTFKTNRELISSTTTEDFALSEVRRIGSLVYKRDYKLGSQVKTSIQIYENEILEILKPKPIHLKQLAFIMLLHSKKYARKSGIFYMTYKQMGEYGAAKNRTRLLKQLMQLEEGGLMEIVARNQKEKGQHHLPNKYRINVAPLLGENFIELDIAINLRKIEFERVVSQLIPPDVLKKIVPQRQFYDKFNKHYIM